jgi:RNA polymerase sigma-70 factor (sigma-E family)
VAPHAIPYPWGGEVMADRTASADRALPAWDADEAVTRLFAAHYRPMVRLATLLLRDPGAAEEVVQDAYVALHAHWRRLRDTDKALAYLRQSVVNRSRSALRRRVVADRYAATARRGDDAPSAESGALGLLEHATVMAALRALPARQREALVLRYYADLSEAQVAEVLGCSIGTVKSNGSRAMAKLRAALADCPEESDIR